MSIVAFAMFPAIMAEQASAQVDASSDAAVDGSVANGAPLGTPCIGPGQCESRRCQDGYCCDGPCGACGACDGADRGLAGASNGICIILPAGYDSAGCLNIRCDGLDSSCPYNCETHDQCKEDAVCNHDSRCVVSNLCSTNEDCSVLTWCDDGICVRDFAVAGGCTEDSQCQSGFCRDGVCCDEDCSGTCMACRVASTGSPDGVCDFVSRGYDPRDDCAPASSSCPSELACNGAGACVCSSDGCDSDGHTLITGNDSEDCAPYRCAGGPGGACRTECDSASDCVRSARCTEGKCVEVVPPSYERDDGGCSLHSANTGRAQHWWAVATLAVLAARRRRATC
jgi:hypothetical protein